MENWFENICSRLKTKSVSKLDIQVFLKDDSKIDWNLANADLAKEIFFDEIWPRKFFSTKFRQRWSPCINFFRIYLHALYAVILFLKQKKKCDKIKRLKIFLNIFSHFLLFFFYFIDQSFWRRKLRKIFFD